MTGSSTAKKTTAKKATASGKPQNADVDHDKVHAAERDVADRLEAERQERIAANTPVDPDPENPAFWRWLARPFPPEDQEKLPRNLKKNDDDKGPCEDTPRGRKYSADGHYCGGWHARSLHLDYIGHAGITMRLNEDVGPGNWDLQPFALGPDRLPIVGRQFWGKLTILGVEKIDLAENFAHQQEAWGDLLRRTASRFGIGTYLWSRSEKALALKANTEQAQEIPEEQKREAEEAGPAPHVVRFKEQWDALTDEAKKDIWNNRWLKAGFPQNPAALSPEQGKVAEGWIEEVVEAQNRANLEQRLGAQDVGDSDHPDAVAGGDQAEGPA